MATDASAIPAASIPIPLSSHHAELPGVRLHYVEAGTGPLVILLHGFPELWYAWRRQIAPLAQAGYRVIAPDLRGYNLSGKPQGISAFVQPGAPTAMINYYRAMLRPSLAPKLTRVDTSTLVIWGEQDPHLGRDLARPSPDRVPNARVEYLPDASHWILHERPEQVNALLLEHFSKA